MSEEWGTTPKPGDLDYQEDGFDPNEPHQFFQWANLAKGDPYCTGCQLPRENARHQGRYTATITIHGNSVEAVGTEVGNVVEFLAHKDDGDEVWWEVDRTWE